jgi:hypothetical protein
MNSGGLPASLRGFTGMYRYTLKFAARSLDESRVRDVLEQEFGLSAIAIVRDGPDTPVATRELPLAAPEPRRDVESLLMGCFADGKPWRRKALIQKNFRDSAPAGHSQRIDAAEAKWSDPENPAWGFHIC